MPLSDSLSYHPIQPARAPGMGGEELGLLGIRKNRDCLSGNNGSYLQDALLETLKELGSCSQKTYV